MTTGLTTGLPTRRVAISRPGRYKSGSHYGDRLAYTSGRHMATSTVRVRVAIWRPAYGDRDGLNSGLHLATGSPFVPLPVWRAQMDLDNTAHSRFVFIDFSFELRSHCHSFRLDWSYCWNFTRNTAKTKHIFYFFIKLTI